MCFLPSRQRGVTNLSKYTMARWVNPQPLVIYQGFWSLSCISFPPEGEPDVVRDVQPSSYCTCNAPPLHSSLFGFMWSAGLVYYDTALLSFQGHWLQSHTYTLLATDPGGSFPLRQGGILFIKLYSEFEANSQGKPAIMYAVVDIMQIFYIYLKKKHICHIWDNTNNIDTTVGKLYH